MIIDVTEIKIAQALCTTVDPCACAFLLLIFEDDIKRYGMQNNPTNSDENGILSFSQAFQNPTNFVSHCALCVVNPDQSNCKYSPESSQPNIPTLNAATTLSSRNFYHLQFNCNTLQRKHTIKHCLIYCKSLHLTASEPS